ncbi:Cupin [Luteimonas sp. 9C]|uniref:cupin domain-containing protein n=1 Tax=Luteimonas sp. 9C TaxID=2653148 RepID=UPI0012EF8B0B|nr:cupin domain-containing protein [Luteimonas sp. 9C]VXC01729.1 Cupin [Luteimonas sp. 9C]
MRVEHLVLGPNDWVPNNPSIAVRVYRGLRAADGHVLDAPAFERTFASHGWPPDWRGGVYAYHHYHSTAHEVLGVYAGRARLEIGGPDGSIFTLETGDALYLPAGTGHRCLNSDDAFRVVGAYPDGQDWDLQRDAPDATTRARIHALPAPPRDPTDGAPF